MRSKKWSSLAVVLTALVLLVGIVVQASPPTQQPDPQQGVRAQDALGTAFTYQGQLESSGEPVNQTCAMAFRLYEQETGDSQVGSPISTTVPVADGLFTVPLDFGSAAFDGDARWLGIQVQCPGDAAYADLGRQALTAAPYALYAAGAPWTGLSSVPAGFADGVDDTGGASYTAGAGLTLDDTEFSVVTSTIQARVAGDCGAGYAIRHVNADGGVVCEPDDDTTYTAGAGLDLTGTEFSVQGSAYEHVVTVAKSGGDYATIQAALDSITDAAADNTYLVWVAPGMYSETVTMKPYVHLQGAGQEATVITSTASGASWPPPPTLALSSDTSLRDLTVGNGGTGNYNVVLLATAGTTRTLVADVTARAEGGGTNNTAVALTGSGTGLTLQDVTALGENGSNGNYGLLNEAAAAATLLGGSFTAGGGFYAGGIYNAGSATLEAAGVTTLAEDGSEYNYGLYNAGGAAATLSGGSFTGRGGNHARGLYNIDSGTTLEAKDVTALGKDGSGLNCGLRNFSGAFATLHGGSFTAQGGSDPRGIDNAGSGTTLEAGGVTALGENGSDYNYGLRNDSGAAATLSGGSFTGRGGSDSSGINNGGSGTTLDATGVTALGENGSDYNYGLRNDSGAAATLSGGSFTARGGTHARGLYNTDSGTTLEASGVTALGENGSSTDYGLVNGNDAAAALRGGSFTAREAVYACGIYNGGSATLEATDVTALAEDGTTGNTGLYNRLGASAVLRGGSFAGRGASDGRGIYNEGSGTTLEAARVTALGEDGTANCGLFNYDGASATLRGGSFIGRDGDYVRGIYNGSSATLDASGATALGEDGDITTYSLHQADGTVRLGATQLVGGANWAGGTRTCFQVYDGSFNAYTCP
jgi:hypothetical protein